MGTLFPNHLQFVMRKWVLQFASSDRVDFGGRPRCRGKGSPNTCAIRDRNDSSPNAQSTRPIHRKGNYHNNLSKPSPFSPGEEHSQNRQEVAAQNRREGQTLQLRQVSQAKSQTR